MTRAEKRENALKAEIKRLEEGLEHIARPNYSAKPTAQDAHDMAAFARLVLRGEQ